MAALEGWKELRAGLWFIVPFVAAKGLIWLGGKPDHPALPLSLLAVFSIVWGAGSLWKKGWQSNWQRTMDWASLSAGLISAAAILWLPRGFFDEWLTVGVLFASNSIALLLAARSRRLSPAEEAKLLENVDDESRARPGDRSCNRM